MCILFRLFDFIFVVAGGHAMQTPGIVYAPGTLAWMLKYTVMDFDVFAQDHSRFPSSRDIFEFFLSILSCRVRVPYTE